jgi:hypothetical protein
MTAWEKRNRIVSVRVTDEEYRQLRAVCLLRGARSVSDLARQAIRGLFWAKGESGESGTEGALDLSVRMAIVEEQVARLAEELAQLKRSGDTQS